MNESLKMVPTGNTDWSTITAKAIHHHYVGNIASHRKLMLPVMFASITLKCTHHTVYLATCSSPCTKGVSSTYKGH